MDDIAALPIAATEPIEMTTVSSMSTVVAIKSPPKKRKPDSDAMDKAVEEFSKAAEQEERELESSTTPSTPNKELLNLTKMTRRGRPIHPPNLESPSGKQCGPYYHFAFTFLRVFHKILFNPFFQNVFPKGGLISESFALWLKSPKQKCQITALRTISLRL